MNAAHCTSCLRLVNSLTETMAMMPARNCIMINSAWWLLATREQISTVTMCTKNDVWSSKNDDTMMGTSANGMTYRNQYLKRMQSRTAIVNTVIRVIRNTMRRRLLNT